MNIKTLGMKLLISALIFLSLIVFHGAYFIPTEIKWGAIYLSASAVFLSGFLILLKKESIQFDALDITFSLFTVYMMASLFWAPDVRNGLVFILCYLSLWAILTFVKNSPIEHIVRPSLWAVSAALVTVLLLHYFVDKRWSGFNNENFVTEFLLSALPFLIGLIVEYRSNRLLKYLGMLSVAVLFFYLLDSNPSKIEFFVLPLALVILGFSYVWKKSPKGTIGFLLVLMLMLGSFVWIKWNVVNGFKGSLEPRFALTYDTTLMYLEHPLIGNGVASFSALFPRFQQAHIQAFPQLDFAMDKFAMARAAHNDFIQFLNDFGLIGVLIVGLMIWSLYHYRSSKKLGVAGWVGLAGITVILANALIEFPLQNPATALVLAISLGLLVNNLGLATLYRANAIWLRFALMVMFVLLSVIFVIATVRLDAAQREYYLMAKHYYTNPQQAFEHNMQAYRHNPLDFHIRVQLYESLVHWNRAVGTPPLPIDEYDAVYAKAKTAGVQYLTTLRRVEYLLDTQRHIERRAEIEANLAWLGRYFSRNPDVWIAEAYYRLLINDNMHAQESLSKVRMLSLNSEQQQRLFSLQMMLQTTSNTQGADEAILPFQME